MSRRPLPPPLHSPRAALCALALLPLLWLAPACAASPGDGSASTGDGPSASAGGEHIGSKGDRDRDGDGNPDADRADRAGDGAPSARAGKGSPKSDSAKHFLWRVTQGAATVYLLGSIHVGSADFYPLSPVIERAFDASAAVAFEVDLSPASQQQAAALMFQGGTFPAGQDIWGALSPETTELLREHLETAGQPPEAVAQLRPWLLGVTLAMSAYIQAGLRPELGIDAHLHSRATAAGKRLLAIETAADQLHALADHPAELQDLMLREALESMGEVDETMGTLVELWQSGDTQAMAEELHSSMDKPQYAPLYRALFLDRNVKMAAAVRTYLEQGATTLVVIGSGHLVGKGSVVELLGADLDVTQL